MAMKDESQLVIDALAKRWWAVALRGVAAIVFGGLTLALPGVTLAVLTLLFGGYAVVEGAFNVIAAVRGRGEGAPWWALLLQGIVSIAAGVVTFVVPALTELALLYMIAAWAVLTGIFAIVAAIRLRRITGVVWALNGVLSIVFGVLTIVAPGAGALSLAWLIGAYALAFGVLLLGLSLRLRRGRAVDARPSLSAVARAAAPETNRSPR
jgi:uncharacterized membrane protein HdeD (DUF308 family)